MEEDLRVTENVTEVLEVDSRLALRLIQMNSLLTSPPPGNHCRKNPCYARRLRSNGTIISR